MPLDQQARALLDRLLGLLPPLNSFTPAEARRLSRELSPKLVGPPETVAAVKNVTISGSGRQISVRIYIPSKEV